MEAQSPNSPSRLRELPSWQIGRSAARAHGLLRRAFAKVEARGYHYRLLLALEEFGPSSQATLASLTGIDRSDVVAALNELAARGEVVRDPDPADRRRNVVTLTRTGARRLRELDRIVAEVQEELLAPLAPGERRELRRLLAIVADSGDQSGLGEVDPGP